MAIPASACSFYIPQSETSCSFPCLALHSLEGMETMLRRVVRVMHGQLHSLVAFLGTFWPGGAGHRTKGAGPARPG